MGIDLIQNELIRIALCYGFDEQSNQLIEEMAELIQAINKYKRIGGEKEFKNILEEIADVEVMIEQIKYLLKIKDLDVENVKVAKVRRQIRRMERSAEKPWG